jgi:probable rRNA maturation factor
MSHNIKSITVSILLETGCDDLDQPALRRLVRRVCKPLRSPRTLVTVALVSDKTMRSLHRKFLGKAKITDVMSFDLSEPAEKRKLFDIIINVEQARRQAAGRGHSIQAETSLYLVHGLLHQLGYDDNTDRQARRMHLEEDRILNDAGFGNIYDSERKG